MVLVVRAGIVLIQMGDDARLLFLQLNGRIDLQDAVYCCILCRFLYCLITEDLLLGG